MDFELNGKVPVHAGADVVVLGGGPAGVAAAIAARRCGSSVVLLERSGELGGMATLGSVAIWMGVGNITGIFREIVSEFMPEKLAETPDFNECGPQFNPFLYRLYLNEKLEREGVRVFFHCSFCKSVKTGDAVTGIVADTREGLLGFAGKVFVDCTGDGRAAIDAGASYTVGRPSDGMPQPMTLMFQMQDTGRPARRLLPEGCPRYESISELPQGRTLHWQRNRDGTLLVNMTRVRGNGAKLEDASSAEREALRQAFSVADYLQRNGFENYVLSHIAPQTGVRETNRVEGLYCLSDSDVARAAKFPDVVAQSNYEIDIHSPDGKGECEEQAIESYDIPYRCLVPRGVRGLLVAGRAISASHRALSSLRVQPTCMALGQAAGAAASIMAQTGCEAADVPVDALHAALRAQGVEFG